MKILEFPRGQQVTIHDDGHISFWAGATIDADGSPRAYAPPSSGLKPLDDLANARDSHGNFVGIDTMPSGRPFIQGGHDPVPGFYVSSTSLINPGFAKGDPRRYIDSETIPFIVLSPRIMRAVGPICLGCAARVTHKGASIDAVVADIGPQYHLGELSIAAAKAVGVPSDARHGGVDAGVFYECWPGKPAEIDGRKFVLQPLG